jgi:hypothetical protein
MDNILSLFHAFFPALDSDVLLINTLLSVIFIVIAILSYYVIMATRVIKWLSNKPKVIKEAINYITSELYNDEKNSQARLAYAKKHLKSNFIKDIYIYQCVELHKSLSGELAHDLKRLFDDLNLTEYAMDHFHSYDWSTKANAISVLAEMECKSARAEIIRFVNHYNIILRYKAQVAAVALAKTEPFDFLQYVNNPLNEWQQLQILNAAMNLETVNLPLFSQWFMHKEPTVIVLCIKLTNHFKQYEASEKIIEKCADPHYDISLEAIIAVRQMGIYNAKSLLLDIYSLVPDPHQLEILRLLPDIGDYSTVQFLKDVALQDDFNHRLLAIESLLALIGNADELLMELYSEENSCKEYELMVNHVLDNQRL